MREWKIKAIVKVALTAIGGALCVKFPDDQLYITIFTALAVILAIILWPVEEEVEEIYYDPPALEKLREILDRPHKQLGNHSKEQASKVERGKSGDGSGVASLTKSISIFFFLKSL